MIIDNTKMEIIGESGDLAIEISNKNPELPAVITTIKEAEHLEALLREFKLKHGSDKG